MPVLNRAAFPFFPTLLIEDEPETLSCRVEDVKSEERAKNNYVHPKSSGGLGTAQGLSNTLYTQ